MSFESNNNGEARRKAERPADTDGAENSGKMRKRGKRSFDSRDLGQALRSAYQETVNETIPPEMLDLLGKLK